MITQRELDEASCILDEARDLTIAMIDGLDGHMCGVFGALSRLITSAKKIIDGEAHA